MQFAPCVDPVGYVNFSTVASPPCCQMQTSRHNTYRPQKRPYNEEAHQYPLFYWRFTMIRSPRLTLLTIIVLLFSTALFTPRPSLAQGGFPLPPAQVVELSGVEPPAPGVEAVVDFAMGGGGRYCTLNQAHLIAGTGFSPSIAPGFGIYVECIEDVAVPLIVHIYHMNPNSPVGTRFSTFVASRSFLPSPARNALVQVRLARSFPYDLSELKFLINRADAPFARWPIGGISPCLGSFPEHLDIGTTVTVTKPLGISFVTDPLQPNAVIATLGQGTALVVMGTPKCGADGLTYWRVTAMGKIGWVPQGTLTMDWIDAFPRRNSPCKGTLPSTLQPGQRARVAVVDGTPANFRIGPDGSLPAYRLLPELTPFTAVFGPICGTNNRNEPVAYWVVQLDDGTKGWIIEVTPRLRVVEPL